jgi:hypothetical protein
MFQMKKEFLNYTCKYAVYVFFLNIYNLFVQALETM